MGTHRHTCTGLAHAKHTTPAFVCHNYSFMSYNIKLFGESLPAKDLNGSSDPYCRLIIDNDKKYESEYIEKQLNPVWKPIQLQIIGTGNVVKIEDGSSFYISDDNTLVIVEIWDKDALS